MGLLARAKATLPVQGVRASLHKVLIFIEMLLSNILRILLPATTYWELMRRYHNLKPRDVRKYDSSIDPFEIHWIDPDSIQYRSDRTDRYRHPIHRFSLVGRVSASDWDRMKGRLSERTFEDRGDYQAFVQRFQGSKDWDEITCISENSKTRDPYYDDLFAEIAENGYQSQFDLLKAGTSSRTFRQAICNEVAIDIGRNGEPLFVDGSHRLAIAKILDVDEIPVVVYHRHELYVSESSANITPD